MNRLRFSAVFGAMALIGSFGLVSPAAAQIDPDVQVLNGTAQGTYYEVPLPDVVARIDGCAAGQTMRGMLYYHEGGDGTLNSGLTAEAGLTPEYPGGAPQTVSFTVPFTGPYEVISQCLQGGVVVSQKWSTIAAVQGALFLFGPESSSTWEPTDKVTVLSAEVGELPAIIDAFDDDSEVTLTINGPDGSTETITTWANSHGQLRYIGVLPHHAVGQYAIVATGQRTGHQGLMHDVVLVGYYLIDDIMPPDDKPNQMPTTGDIGLVPFSAVAVFGLAAGGLMALRSRKH